jgi:hypothetical protein
MANAKTTTTTTTTTTNKSAAPVAPVAPVAPAPEKYVLHLQEAIVECPAPSLVHITALAKVFDDDMKRLAASLLLNGPSAELLAGSWGALRQVKSVYKTCAECNVEALRAAWNAKQETADRRTKLSLNGLKAAAKAAGLIAPGTAPGKKEAEPVEPANDSALARKIVEILSKGTPSTQIKAILKLPEIVAEMQNCEAEE